MFHDVAFEFGPQASTIRFGSLTPFFSYEPMLQW